MGGADAGDGVQVANGDGGAVAVGGLWCDGLADNTTLAAGGKSKHPALLHPQFGVTKANMG